MRTYVVAWRPTHDSKFRELDDHFHILVIAMQSVHEILWRLTTRYELSQPRAVRPSQRVCCLIPMSLISIDAADHDVVAQDDLRGDVSRRKRRKYSACAYSGETHHTAGCDAAHRFGDDAPVARTLDDHIRFEPELQH